jgi:hypothetical protein
MGEVEVRGGSLTGFNGLKRFLRLIPILMIILIPEAVVWKIST